MARNKYPVQLPWLWLPLSQLSLISFNLPAGVQSPSTSTRGAVWGRRASTYELSCIGLNSFGNFFFKNTPNTHVVLHNSLFLHENNLPTLPLQSVQKRTFPHACRWLPCFLLPLLGLQRRAMEVSPPELSEQGRNIQISAYQLTCLHGCESWHLVPLEPMHLSSKMQQCSDRSSTASAPELPATFLSSQLSVPSGFMCSWAFPRDSLRVWEGQTAVKNSDSAFSCVIN